MKDKILELRKQGKTYKEICDTLLCSKGLVSYYCGDDQKEKTRKAQNKRRSGNRLIQRLEHFRLRAKDFQRRTRSGLKSISEKNFTTQDVVDKFGMNTVCYLSGKKINMTTDKDFQFDHIIPASKGGTNDLENLGILDREVNIMKQDMLVEDLLEKCKIILEYNGYKVSK